MTEHRVRFGEETLSDKHRERRCKRARAADTVLTKNTREKSSEKHGKDQSDAVDREHARTQLREHTERAARAFPRCEHAKTCHERAEQTKRTVDVEEVREESVEMPAAKDVGWTKDAQVVEV